MSQLLNRLLTKARAIRRSQCHRDTLAGLGAEFTCDPGRPGAELVTVRGLTFSIKSEEDLFILTEIFDHQCYNFSTTGETVVIDIGMNIGVASLFFASDPNVCRVFSFEPFRRTYELACANLRWNPAYAAKITTKNFGLADRDGVEELPYIEERKGSVGINGLPRSFTPARQDLHMERIELCEAATVLRPIFADYPEAQIVLKIDCEGSEYGIFKNLDAAGLLGRFQAIMLEWHNHGPHPLRETLEKHGFSVFTFGDQPSATGMLYAINVRAAQRRADRATDTRSTLCPMDASLDAALVNVAELAKL
ncbi:MAG TPA: FkbM family methyltransferase [Pirellulales bacterium]|nr:FkbM family methyltransferase [Pirellulales bacterium]